MNDRRNAVFLEEMGVGPQWRLRNRPASADAAAAAEAFAPAAEPMPAPAQHVPAAVQQTAQATQPAAAAPHAAHGATQAGGSAQRSAHGPADATPEGRQGARADQQPAVAAASAAPLAPARVPGTPSIASTGEDMSWFDDAPTPEYKPQRKKVAAPEQPEAAQAPRPAPATPMARPAPQPMRPAAPQAHPASAPPASAAYDAPPYDDVPMDEPPTWFDDDQPSTAAGAPAAPAGRATDDQIAHMEWPALQAAVASCTRCARCETRQQAIVGRGDEQATWIALDTAPGQAEDTEGYQFAGDPGYLLDNMLKAVGQSTEQGAYLTSLVKCHAPHGPTAEELDACRPYLQRELALTQAKVIVAFGHSTGKGLLGAAARGRILMHGSVPVVATYHPADLLKKPEEKAKAWQDLCLAKAAHAGRR